MAELTRKVSIGVNQGIRMFTKSTISKFGKTANNLRNLGSSSDQLASSVTKQEETQIEETGTES